MPLKKSAKANGSYGAWIGRVEDVARVGGVIEAGVRDLAEAWVKDKGAAAGERRRGYSLRTGRELAKDVAQAAAEAGAAAAAEVDPLVEATVVEREFDHTITGNVEEVLIGLDPEDVVSVTLATPYALRDTAQISVALSKDGARWRVSGADNAWVRGMSSLVDSAVRKQVPWWRWLGNDGLRFVVWMVSTYSAFFGGAVTANQYLPSAWAVAVGGAVALATALLGIGLARSMRRFQLVRPGERAFTTTTLAFAGALSVEFLVGIVANLAS